MLQGQGAAAEARVQGCLMWSEDCCIRPTGASNGCRVSLSEDRFINIESGKAGKTWRSVGLELELLL